MRLNLSQLTNQVFTELIHVVGATTLDVTGVISHALYHQFRGVDGRDLHQVLEYRLGKLLAVPIAGSQLVEDVHSPICELSIAAGFRKTYRSYCPFTLTQRLL